MTEGHNTRDCVRKIVEAYTGYYRCKKGTHNTKKECPYNGNKQAGGSMVGRTEQKKTKEIKGRIIIARITNKSTGINLRIMAYDRDKFLGNMREETEKQR